MSAHVQLVEMLCSLGRRPSPEEAERLRTEDIDCVRTRAAEYGEVWSSRDFDDMWKLVWGLPTVKEFRDEQGRQPADEYVSLLMREAFEPARRPWPVTT